MKIMRRLNLEGCFLFGNSRIESEVFFVVFYWLLFEAESHKIDTYIKKLNIKI